MASNIYVCVEKQQKRQTEKFKKVKLKYSKKNVLRKREKSVAKKFNLNFYA